MLKSYNLSLNLTRIACKDYLRSADYPPIIALAVYSLFVRAYYAKRHLVFSGIETALPHLLIAEHTSQGKPLRVRNQSVLTFVFYRIKNVLEGE